MNILISIIIPVYNAEKYLDRCLKSVVSQTYQNLEIIVVDDGSTDQSWDIIEKFASTDSRIIKIQQENVGVSAARNRGLEIANGDFIGFVDADDEILPDMYEFLLSNALKYNADISHCGFEWVKNVEVIPFHNTGMLLVQNHNEGIIEILEGKLIEPGIWTKLYRRKIISKVRFSEGIKWNEDLLFNVEAFNNAQISVFEDVVKYRYFQNVASASQSVFTEDMAKDIFEVSLRIKQIVEAQNMNSGAEIFYVNKLITLLQAARAENIMQTDIITHIKKQLRKTNTWDMEFRVSFLKFILLNIPFFYRLFYFIYSLTPAKNRKWQK